VHYITQPFCFVVSISQLYVNSNDSNGLITDPKEEERLRKEVNPW
jgi:hypothetical protein